jgi:hypothetical protein
MGYVTYLNDGMADSMIGLDVVGDILSNIWWLLFYRMANILLLIFDNYEYYDLGLYCCSIVF